MKKERLTTYLVYDKKFLMQGFTKRNISGANQHLRVKLCKLQSNRLDQHLGGVVTPTHADDDAYAVGPGSWAGLRASAAVRRTCRSMPCCHPMGGHTRGSRNNCRASSLLWIESSAAGASAVMEHVWRTRVNWELANLLAMSIWAWKKKG
jgi:hypothetical protein